MLVAMGDAHVKDMGKAFVAPPPGAEVTSDMTFTCTPGAISNCIANNTHKANEIAQEECGTRPERHEVQRRQENGHEAIPEGHQPDSTNPVARPRACNSVR